MIYYCPAQSIRIAEVLKGAGGKQTFVLIGRGKPLVTING
jgi:hypothetical protein